MGLTEKRASIARRAVFFTMTAVILLAVLVVIITAVFKKTTVDTGIVFAEDTDFTRQRFEEHYFPLALRMYAGTALRALADDSITVKRDLILPTDFETVSVNATYRGRVLAVENATAAFKRLTDAAQSAGIANITVTVSNVTIIQTASYIARAEANLTYTLTSYDRATRYTRNVIITTDFSLLGIPDPLYSRNSGGTTYAERRVFAPFIRTGWNTTEIERLASTHAYITDPSAPSIFARLQNNLTASTYGVISLIPQNFTPSDNLTSVDFEYINSTNTPCRYADTNLTFSYSRMVLWNITGTTLKGVASCPTPMS